MPTYDFKCRSCGSHFSLFFKSFSAYAAADVHPCVHCQSALTVRTIGRVAVAKGAHGRLDALADSRDVDETDPKSLENFYKRLGQELDTDLN